jgi:hypothetical protein
MLHRDLICKVNEEAKFLFKKYFPLIPPYEKKLRFRGLRIIKLKKSIDFGYNAYIRKITIYSYSVYKKMDITALEERIIDDDLHIKIKRKNSYLISLIHELAETSHDNYKYQIKKIKSLKRFYNDNPHLFAINIELHILKKLIKCSAEEDRNDFIKRFNARMKDLKKSKHEHHLSK